MDVSVKDWWDAWAQEFGYDYWDWGIAADWVTGLLTGLAFLLAAAVYYGDDLRRRRSSADNFTARVEIHGGPPAISMTLTVHGYNASDAPLPMVILHYRRDGKMSRAFMKSSTGTFHIPPRTEASVEVPYGGELTASSAFLEIIDPHNRPWYRDVFVQKYRSDRTYKRWKKDSYRGFRRWAMRRWAQIEEWWQASNR
jgi:hypothetical protein